MELYVTYLLICEMKVHQSKNYFISDANWFFINVHVGLRLRAIVSDFNIWGINLLLMIFYVHVLKYTNWVNTMYQIHWNRMVTEKCHYYMKCMVTG
jgi:hypothetical protein